jgi:effector-binding domain-containing protein
MAETAILAAEFVEALPPDLRAVFTEDLQDALSGERSLIVEWHFLNALAWFARNGCLFHLRDDADAPLVAGIAETEVAILPVALDADAGRRVGRRAWFGLADQLAPLFPLATADAEGARLIAIEFDNEPPEELEKVAGSVRDAINSGQPVTGDGWTVRIEDIEGLKPGMDTPDVLKVLGQQIRAGAHYAITEGEKGLLAVAAWSKANDDIPAALCRQLEELIETSGKTIVTAFIEELSADEWSRLSEAEGFRNALTAILEARPDLTALRLAHQGHIMTAPSQNPFGDIPATLWNPADDRTTQVMRAALG